MTDPDLAQLRDEVTRRGFLRQTAKASIVGGALGLFATVPAMAQAQVSAIYVSPLGDDIQGTGCIGAPFKTISHATLVATPGTTIYLRPGVYAPFTVHTSGIETAPITITSLPNETHQAIIDGRLGVLGNTTKHGAYIVGKDHVHIRNLIFQDCLETGIWIIGKRPSIHGHHQIANNIIRRTGGPGISVQGYLSSEHLPIGTVWTTDVLIEHNDISETNMILPHKPNGGVNECITVAGGVQNVITRYNDIHDSRQYGIDYKHGFVGGGEIYGNRIWNIERFGIYLDTNRLEVHDVEVHSNLIWQCNVGIVMAREANNQSKPPLPSELRQSFRDICIFNNLIWDMGVSGIFMGAHPNDTPDGEIHNVKVLFNTIYNCGVSAPGQEMRLTGWSRDEYIQAGIVSDFVVAGNLAHRPGYARAFITDQFSGKPGFHIEQNMWAGDPLFRAPDLPIQDLKGALPDFGLLTHSPARNVVTRESYNQMIDQNISQVTRQWPTHAGAY